MTVPALAHATTAAPLAALLPNRRGKAWTVGPAPYCIRNHAATSRISDGRRALLVVEEGNRVELYAYRPDLFPVTPDAVTDSTDPASVATLATRALRSILPDLDADAMWAAAHDPARDGDGLEPWQRIMQHKGAELTELGFDLLNHGARPEPAERPDGPGLEWTADSGAQWAVWSYGIGAGFHLTYEGPLHGLYGALPVLLPPLGAHTRADAGSAFTRHLTDRFPQLDPVDADEVAFGGYQDLSGWIALPSRAEPGDPVDDTTRVCAEVGAVGIDFLLSAAAYLL